MFLSWSDADQEKAIAWNLIDRATCDYCGTRPEEWDESRGGSRRAYYWEEHICPGCNEKDIGQRALSEYYSDGQPSGSRVILVPAETEQE